MKKQSFFFIFIVLFIYPILVFGVEPPKFEKKIYVNNQGKIYVWNADIHLFIGTGPDPGEATRLRSLADPKGNSESGFRFDGEGDHVIFHPEDRKKNYLSSTQNKKSIFPVVSDQSPPSIRFNYNPNSKIKVENRIIYPGGVSLKALISDKLSGVQATYVSVNGAEYVPYENSYQFTEEGLYDLFFYAADNVGNSTVPVPQKIGIDKTPPVSVVYVAGPRFGETIVGPYSKILISAKDNLSGVEKIFYQINQGKVRVYRFPISLNNFKEGNYRMKHFASDLVQNREEDQFFDYYLDKTPPVIQFEFVNDFYENQNLIYVSPRSEILLTAKDEKTQVENLRYSLNSGKMEPYEEPIRIPQNRVNHEIFYQSADVLGNESPLLSQKLVLDKLPPKILVDFEGPHYFSRNIDFIKKDETVIKVRAVDELSGTQYIETTKDDNISSTTDQNISFSSDGRHTLKISAVDNVNNVSEQREVAVHVDDIPPQVFYRISPSEIETDSKEADTVAVYPSEIDMFFSAKDDDSGIDKIVYQINGGAENEYELPFELKEPGLYSVLVTAFDNVGNETSKTIRFRLQETP